MKQYIILYIEILHKLQDWLKHQVIHILLGIYRKYLGHLLRYRS